MAGLIVFLCFSVFMFQAGYRRLQRTGKTRAEPQLDQQACLAARDTRI